MEIKTIDNKKTWEGFLSGIKEKTFLQSWNWGEFQILQGNKIYRLGIYEKGELIGVSLVEKILARRGTFLFIPHGPIVSEDKRKDALRALIFKLKNLSLEERASFVRFSPFWESNSSIFKSLGFRQAPIHMHAETTWELDVTPSEEKLLANMRKTTRYLIKQAAKNKDIEIEKSESLSDLDRFLPIYIDTAKRHHFTIFSKDYLRDEFAAFISDKQVQYFFGKYKGEIVSAAMFIFWQNGAFYHHSGSLLKYSKAPVNYLMQWEAIREAKKRGCAVYNFWGIAPGVKTEQDAKESKHPWAGLSLFKMGFGGYRRDLTKTQDYIISPAYWINYIIETVRKLKRRL